MSLYIEWSNAIEEILNDLFIEQMAIIRSVLQSAQKTYGLVSLTT
jgi:hypothetical protein